MISLQFFKPPRCTRTSCGAKGKGKGYKHDSESFHAKHLDFFDIVENKISLQILLPPFHEQEPASSRNPGWFFQLPHPRLLGLLCLVCPFLSLRFHRFPRPFVEHIGRANKGPAVGLLIGFRVLGFGLKDFGEQ